VSGLEELLRGGLIRARPDPPLGPGTPAGVLVPVIETTDGTPALLFTVRSDQVRDHKSEISFPGGVRHGEDADLLATAVRETEEELGMRPSSYEVLGALPPVDTVVTGYVIVPFVAMLRGRPEMEPSPVEIAEILEFEVGRLARAEEEVTLEGQRAWFAYTLDGRTVWGATGRIVHAFLEVLRGAGWQGGR
jgi:8-oxo-dGTP pyrophosphatase MutT (NUDIX family)